MSGELYNQRQRLVGGQQNGSTYSCGDFNIYSVKKNCRNVVFVKPESKL